MHDFHLADQIYHEIIEAAEKNDLKKIKAVEIELGSIIEHGEEVLPENVIFNIKLLAKGGPAEDLEVKVEKIIGDYWVLKSIDGD